MRPITISANNFITPHRIGGANFKMPSFKRNKMSIKKKLGRTTQTAQVIEPPIIDTRGLAQVLQKYTIYIDDSVQYKEQVGMIAEGMGATVQHNQDDTVAGSPSTLSSVGIYIIQPKRAEKNKLIARLTKKGIRVISPAWLFTCYEKNTYLSPDQFPYGVKTAKEGLGVSVPLSKESIEQLDNPFGLEPVNYDYLEDNRPGRQLNLDNYITKKRSHTSIKEKEERKKASEKRMLEIKNAAKAFETKYSRRKRDKKKEKYDVPSSNEHGRDKMNIWYAEQALPK
ncbi:hypothetical protein INT48_001991 [Thamnidium elegans]|uniref:BRCT domain-containing protein n=1 Tax=Thamnidium elegans TaxID=101142 RepID=A0A8H7SZ82_9FUNG|nr:hypothetical protein INT48_001991 [Thamnidium elegans]